LQVVVEAKDQEWAAELNRSDSVGNASEGNTADIGTMGAGEVPQGHRSTLQRCVTDAFKVLDDGTPIQDEDSDWRILEEKSQSVSRHCQ
jgi:hypothetical protein